MEDTKEKRENRKPKKRKKGEGGAHERHWPCQVSIARAEMMMRMVTSDKKGRGQMREASQHGKE